MTVAWLLKGTVSRDVDLRTRPRDEEEDEGTVRIRCPLCGWEPSESDRWSCSVQDTPEPPFDACGTIWNTFATRGRCPGCHHQWKWTTCGRCHQASLHEDWYQGG